jgi:hypothetical protein
MSWVKSTPAARRLQQAGEATRAARPPGVRSVFISYRRQLSETLARLIRKDLIEHGFDAFMDLEDLGSGAFGPKIFRQIVASKHLIVLLEPGSLAKIGEDGDWLRLEIAWALAIDRNVVPVTVGGFELSRDLVLPPDVAKLSSLNAVSIPPGYFGAAMDRLRNQFLKMPSSPTAPPPPQIRGFAPSARPLAAQTWTTGRTGR